MSDDRPKDEKGHPIVNCVIPLCKERATVSKTIVRGGKLARLSLCPTHDAEYPVYEKKEDSDG